MLPNCDCQPGKSKGKNELRTTLSRHSYLVPSAGNVLEPPSDQGVGLRRMLGTLDNFKTL